MSNTFLSGWARAVVALSNLVFLVLDTTGIKRDSDIIRVLIVNLAGEELYHQVVRPLRQTTQPNTLYTGLVQADLDQATTLAEQWPVIQEALKGKYVLAYGLDFVQARLIDSAQAYHLEPPIYLVGDCLHEFAGQYCHRTSITLAQACAHVGFPRHINSAQERAQAQIALLQAIADSQPRPARIAAFQPAKTRIWTTHFSEHAPYPGGVYEGGETDEARGSGGISTGDQSAAAAAGQGDGGTLPSLLARAGGAAFSSFGDGTALRG